MRHKDKCTVITISNVNTSLVKELGKLLQVPWCGVLKCDESQAPEETEGDLITLSSNIASRLHNNLAGLE